MTENNKPEWFEIAENDGPAQPIKTRRSLSIAAVLAAALIIGAGAVVAQTQDDAPANATETKSVSTNQVNSSATDAATNQTSPTASSSAPQVTATPTTSALANPNIAKLPTGGEKEGDHQGRDHHGLRPPHSEGDQPVLPEDNED